MSNPRNEPTPEDLDPTTKLSGLSPQQDEAAHEIDPSDDEDDGDPDAVIANKTR